MKSLAMRIAYLDMVGGCSGDMTLGALVDAGAPFAELKSGLRSLGVAGFELRSERQQRGAIAATKVHVTLGKKADHTERRLRDVLAVIDNADLPERARTRARLVFERLAAAEAKVHGISPDKVHFHEVGAVDAIVDVVGSALGFELLGIERIESSPLPVTRGRLRSAHGEIPLPGPAVLALAALAHAPLEPRDGFRELVTPTGAAIATALAARIGPYPSFSLESVGYGAGSREDEPGAPPNVLRIAIGTQGESALPETVVVLEANLDNQNPEVLGSVFETLKEAGALEVFLAPVTMKKGRAAVVLTALAEPARAALVEEAILRETTTLGVRRHTAERTVLPREIVTVETPLGPARVKIAKRPGGATASPEHDDCLAISRAKKVPLREVYRVVEEAAEKLRRSEKKRQSR
ncbi:nickel pincer cofactor biosynthesis protein LarC [bacterium]|nr:nickel pincer cofactor biosynthesis protein LarC [bacterium]